MASWYTAVLQYASLGHVAELKVAATTNQAILALLPRPEVHPPYMKRWLEHLRPSLRAEASSNTQDNLNAEKVRNLPLMLPPLSEQLAIAAFLDRETGKIDALVEEQRRLIDLLREKRQAVISHAVTKGLDPNAKMKPSGVEWLGDVPEHWVVSTLGRQWQLQGGFAFASSDFGQEGIPLVRMNNLNRGRLELEDAPRVPPEVCNDRTALVEGDLVWGMSGSVGETGSLGNFARVRKEDLPAQLNQRVGRFISVDPRANVEFLQLFIQSQVFSQQVLGCVTGTAQFNISSDQVQSIFVAFPPTSERNGIVSYVEPILGKYDLLMREAETATHWLLERRSALIAAAVTGQIDVRTAAIAETPAA